MTEQQERETAIDTAASALAEYLWAYKMRPDGSVFTIHYQRLLAEMGDAINEKLQEFRREAAKERALEEKADRDGYRY